MSYLTWVVLVGTSLLGAVAGVLGCFAVLRRRALAGDVVSHAALPGLCLAFLLLGRREFWGMLLGALATGLAGMALATWVSRGTRTKEDAALGIVLSTFFGAGVVLSSIIQNRPGGGAKAGLETYIYGQAAGMVLADVAWIAVLSAGVLLLVLLLYKELKLLSFDPEFAQVQGWPTLGLDLALMAVLALVTVTGLPIVGVILMAAMLILPAAAARFWTERLGPMLVLAAVLGAIPGVVGTLLSAGVVAHWLGFDPLAFGPNPSNLPTGPLIVLCGTVVFLVSALGAPRRGVLYRALAAARLRLGIARENLLRSLYELSEPALPDRPTVYVSQLLAARAWRTWQARWLVRWARWRGWVEPVGTGIRLTPAGLEQARQLVRIHRLWERFLIERADIAPDHVDRDADTLEHLLGPEVVEELQRRMEAPLSPDAVPQSPHEIPRAGSTMPMPGGDAPSP